MREIKFRAWDTRKMHYFNSMQVCDNGLWFNNDSFDLGENHCDDEKAIVMQYTGLKDKDGKEIYEGDILQKSEGLPITKKPHHFRQMVGTMKRVFFHEGSFKLTKSNASSNYNLSSFLIRYYGLIIVGNIYQNPELTAEKL